MQQAPGRPAWVERVQRQGLTPAVLETYLAAGWPIATIAKDRHLELDDVINVMKRWDIALKNDAG